MRGALAVQRQVLEADEVRVVAPTLTGRLQSWVSDIDAAALAADERMQAIVGSIGEAGQAAARGQIGDENRIGSSDGDRRTGLTCMVFSLGESLPSA